MSKREMRSWPIPEVDYGLVLITRGRYAGRIGDYDDDDDNPFRGIVYFGGMFRSRGYCLIDKRYFKEPTVNDLYRRYTAIAEEVFDLLNGNTPPEPEDYEHLCSIMAEQHQIYTELEWRNLMGRYGTAKQGRTIYLAHSSLDKGIVRMVHDDLKQLGHSPWLDENEISVGESIITKLEKGISHSEFMMVFLSKKSENSEWVRAEWESKFSAEIKRQGISLLPALLEDCEIPPILKRLKYADFRKNYDEGLTQILSAIGHSPKGNALGRTLNLK